MFFLNLALILFFIGNAIDAEEEECLSNQWAVKLHSGSSPSLVAARNGLLLQELLIIIPLRKWFGEVGHVNYHEVTGAVYFFPNIFANNNQTCGHII